jgi:hypothetical protein
MVLDGIHKKKTLQLYIIIILMIQIIVIMFLLFMIDIIQLNSHTIVYTNAFVVDLSSMQSIK